MRRGNHNKKEPLFSQCITYLYIKYRAYNPTWFPTKPYYIAWKHQLTCCLTIFFYFFVCILLFHSDCLFFLILRILPYSSCRVVILPFLPLSSLAFFSPLFFSHFTLYFHMHLWCSLSSWMHLSYAILGLPSSPMNLCCTLLLYLWFFPKLYPKTTCPTWPMYIFRASFSIGS
jgi:hypothetical protein